MYKPGEVSTRVGVDLGENTIYAAAAVDAETGEVRDNGVIMDETITGNEFRHQLLC
ncbi:hypothetical protein [Halobiforma nitratireducens]|uniref:hypothetical protein n=1 Tax=Halobiforma nitratireducens TaxID=130048 RepID=UPI00135F1723|nr:hypothetical protein [Halobiforma nitratireducens]